MLQCTTNVLLWFLLRKRFNSGEPRASHRARARTYVPCMCPPGWTCRSASHTRRDLSTVCSSRAYVNRGVKFAWSGRRRIITREYRGFPCPLAQAGRVRVHRSASMHVATHVQKRDADARARTAGRSKDKHDKALSRDLEVVAVLGA